MDEKTNFLSRLYALLVTIRWVDAECVAGLLSDAVSPNTPTLLVLLVSLPCAASQCLRDWILR